MSRVNVRDSSKHVILGTQQYKPSEFATQITLNMDNAWGILRCIIDLCMKQKDGKYLIMKDPNKVIFVFLAPRCYPSKHRHLVEWKCIFRKLLLNIESDILILFFLIALNR